MKSFSMDVTRILGGHDHTSYVLGTALAVGVWLVALTSDNNHECPQPMATTLPLPDFSCPE